MWILIITNIISASVLVYFWIDRNIILSCESNRQVKNSFEFNFHRKEPNIYPANGYGIGGSYGTQFLSEVTIVYKFEIFLSLKNMLELECYYPSEDSLEELIQQWKKYPYTEGFKNSVRKVIYKDITNLFSNLKNFDQSSIAIECTYREYDKEVDYTYLLWAG